MMIAIRTFGFALGIVLAASGAARADDAAARAVLDKALKAHGGEDTLAKLPASTVAMKGKIHTMGLVVDFTGEVMSFGPEHVKLDLQIEVGGQQLQIVNVVAGKNGWSRVANETKEMSKEELEEGLEQAHSSWSATLAPLKRDKRFTLTLIGEIEIDKKPAVGIKVGFKGRRDIDFYFDKTTGLLVKTEGRAKDEAGQEVHEEAFFSNYKDVQGTKQPMKIVVKRDGKVFLEAEMTNVTLAEKLEPAVFAKP